MSVRSRAEMSSSSALCEDLDAIAHNSIASFAGCELVRRARRRGVRSRRGSVAPARAATFRVGWLPVDPADAGRHRTHLLAPGRDGDVGRVERVGVGLARDEVWKRSELLGLDWSDADLDRRLIRVRRAKGGRRRVVPIHPALASLSITSASASGAYPGADPRAKTVSFVGLSESRMRLTAAAPREEVQPDQS